MAFHRPNVAKYTQIRTVSVTRLLCIIALLTLLIYCYNFICDQLFTNVTRIYGSPTSFNLALNSTLDPSTPTLCIIVRVYSAQLSYFSILALGLYHTGLHNIRIYVINTDLRTDLQQLKQTINFINNLVLRNDFVVFLDSGQPSSGQDFGYEMTDRALAYLYKQNLNSSSSSSSVCQYVTVTNGDNFYSRNFVRKILPHMKEGKDIIAWGFVSHHYKPHYQEKIDKNKKTVPEVVDDGTEKCTPVELKSGYADLGAVAYRLSFLQQHNLYFRPTGGSYSWGSDGYFVTVAASRTNSSVILKQTLFVHQ